MKERRETNLRWGPHVFSSLQNSRESLEKLLILVFLPFHPLICDVVQHAYVVVFSFFERTPMLLLLYHHVTFFFSWVHLININKPLIILLIKL
jgi:hypothetical protein